MTAQLIDGNALARQIRADVSGRTAALKARGIQPTLAIVLVGDDPASQVYVRNKVKACEEAGIHSVLENAKRELLAVRGPALPRRTLRPRNSIRPGSAIIPQNASVAA